MFCVSLIKSFTFTEGANSIRAIMVNQAIQVLHMGVEHEHWR